MTRGAAIEYNFMISPYRVEVDDNIFVFSSQLHADKFRERLSEKREAINYSLSNRFNVTIEYNIIADIMLYKEIEQRGFLIITKGGAARCLNNIILSGEKLTLKKSAEL